MLYYDSDKVFARKIVSQGYHGVVKSSLSWSKVFDTLSISSAIFLYWQDRPGCENFYGRFTTTALSATKILEVEFSGSRIILYSAGVNLTLLSHHQTPNPSSSFSPVPVCCPRIFLMTWFPKAKTTLRLASTFTSHAILKMSQFPITTSCYFFLKWASSRVIYVWSYFSKEDVSA